MRIMWFLASSTPHKYWRGSSQGSHAGAVTTSATSRPAIHGRRETARRRRSQAGAAAASASRGLVLLRGADRPAGRRRASGEEGADTEGGVPTPCNVAGRHVAGIRGGGYAYKRPVLEARETRWLWGGV